MKSNYETKTLLMNPAYQRSVNHNTMLVSKLQILFSSWLQRFYIYIKSSSCHLIDQKISKIISNRLLICTLHKYKFDSYIQTIHLFVLGISVKK